MTTLAVLQEKASMLSRRHFSEGILTALINLGTTNELQDDTAASIEQFICAVYQPRTQGGGPRVVVSTAAFHARVRGSVPGLGGLKETKNVSSPSTCESQYCGEPP